MRPSSAARFRGAVGRAWAGVGGGGLPPARAAPRPAAAPGPPATAAEAATHPENELAHIHKTSDAQEQSRPSQIRKLQRPEALRSAWRPSLADVERLTRGEAARARGAGSRAVPHRLDAEERPAYERAVGAGFVTVAGTGYRRGRKGAPLVNSCRQRADALGHAFVRLEKGRAEGEDAVVVDLSPLRVLDDAFYVALATATAAEVGVTDPEDGATPRGPPDRGLLETEAVWRLPSREVKFTCGRAEAKPLAAALVAALGVPTSPPSKARRRTTGTRKMEGRERASASRRRRGRVDDDGAELV